MLVHEQNVSLGAAHQRLVDGAAEQPLEKAAFAAADDDEVGVPLVGDLEQPLRRIAQLDEVLGLSTFRRASDVRARSSCRRASSSGSCADTGLGSGTVPPGATGPATAGGPSSAVGSNPETGAATVASPLTLTTTSRAEKTWAISAARF